MANSTRHKHECINISSAMESQRLALAESFAITYAVTSVEQKWYMFQMLTSRSI